MVKRSVYAYVNLAKKKGDIDDVQGEKKVIIS